MLALGQSVNEQLLEEHAVASGARVLRGEEVVSLTQGPDAVEVVTRAGTTHRTVQARRVVGCDGTRSAVRPAAGIGFPGQDTTLTGWLADVELDEPPAGPLAATGPAGSLLAAPIGDGVHRLAGLSTATMHRGTGEPLPLEEVREQTRTLLGRDLGMRNPRWLSRYGNATRQATRYRAGRVLVAGDAAHVFFPAGGQGMNLGIQDATDLGWKLAATLQDRAPDGLLDSYDTERRLAARAVIDNTRAQLALFAAANPEQIALREVWSAALAEPRTNHRRARRTAGFDDPLPATPRGPHPLNGTRLRPHPDHPGRHDHRPPADAPRPTPAAGPRRDTDTPPRRPPGAPHADRRHRNGPTDLAGRHHRADPPGRAGRLGPASTPTHSAADRLATLRTLCR